MPLQEPLVRQASRRVFNKEPGPHPGPVPMMGGGHVPISQIISITVWMRRKRARKHTDPHSDSSINKKIGPEKAGMDGSLEGPEGRVFPGGQDRVKGAFNLVGPREEQGRYPTPRVKRMRGETALDKSNKAKKETEV